MSDAETFFRRGWIAFEADALTTAWARAARPVAAALMAPGVARESDIRCDGTWFAGVNVFPNGPDGSVPSEDVPPLAGAAVAFVRDVLGLEGFAWDWAQVSACYPGYPRQDSEESEANHRYRVLRDAAHVDGLLRDADRRRTLGETHAFILGLPLVEAAQGAAPFVVWERSHEVMRAAFRDRLSGIDPADWGREDITETYHAARRAAFDTCPRVEITAPPGGAYLVHRLALHGVAPWRAGEGPPRLVAYFRPDPYPDASPAWWLEAP